MFPNIGAYYESKLAALPDVMDVAAVVDFTGYNRRTVCQWIRVGKLKVLALLQKYMIPKCYLIDWLCSDDYNNTNRKSRRHIDMLWEAQKWRDRCGHFPLLSQKEAQRHHSLGVC